MATEGTAWVEKPKDSYNRDGCGLTTYAKTLVTEPWFLTPAIVGGMGFYTSPFKGFIALSLSMGALALLWSNRMSHIKKDPTNYPMSARDLCKRKKKISTVAMIASLAAAGTLFLFGASEFSVKADATKMAQEAVLPKHIPIGSYITHEATGRDYYKSYGSIITQRVTAIKYCQDDETTVVGTGPKESLTSFIKKNDGTWVSFGTYIAPDMFRNCKFPSGSLGSTPQ